MYKTIFLVFVTTTLLLLSVPAFSQNSSVSTPAAPSASQSVSTNGATAPGSGSGTAASSDATLVPQTDETKLSVATNGKDSSASGGSVNVFSAWDFIRMVLILLAVIGAIYGIFFLLKKTGSPRFQENKLIRVLSSRNLTNSRSLHLVEVGNEVFLVGSAENNVNLVATITDKETLDSLKLQATNTDASERRGFGDVFGQVFGKGQPATGRPLLDPVAFLKEQRKRLKKI